jgi:integrase
MRLRKITTDDVEDYLARRREENSSRGTQRAGSSVNRERAVLSGIFTLAIKKGYYSGQNPVRGVERFEETGQRKRVLNHDEEARLMAALREHDPVLRHVAQIALQTGMRRAEVCLLRWEWLDFARGKKGYINLPATVTKNKKPRSIPMLYNVQEHLLELRGSDYKAAGAVFGLDPNSTGQRIARICKAIGLHDVSLHVLRHTFATHCLDAGVHPFVVKQWMGHSTLAQTDYYTHVGFAENESAAAQLEGKMAEIKFR